MWDRRVIPAIVALIAGLCAQFAVAQDDFYPRGGQHLRITITDFYRHVESLGLTEAERDEARDALDVFIQRFDEARDDWLRCYFWINSNTPMTYNAWDVSLNAVYYQDERVLAREWQTGVRELEQCYFDQLSELFPQQRDRVAQLHETHVRRRVLAAIGFLQDNPAPGAQLDLTELFSADAAIDNPGVDEVLSAYAEAMRPIVAELDEVLRRFRRAYRAPMQAIRDGGPDAPDLEQRIGDFEDLWVTPYQLRWRVYELNRRTLSALLAEVSTERARELRAAAWPILYPYAYEDPEDVQQRLDDRITLALRRNDLTAAQVSAVADVRAALHDRRSRFIARTQRRYAAVHGPQFRVEEVRWWVRYLLYRDRTDSEVNEAAQRELDATIDEWTAGLADLHAAIDAIVADVSGDES